MTTITTLNLGSAKRVRSSRSSAAWALALTTDDGSSVVAPITHPFQRKGARRCLPADAKDALFSMKGHDLITVDHIDDLTLEALESLSPEMLGDVVTVWKMKKLGFPTATMVWAVVECLTLARAVSALNE